MADRGTVGIIGAGTMGAGIAQVAATSGWTVELMDVDEATVQRALSAVAQRLERLVEKGRLGAAEREQIVARLQPATSPSCFDACDLLIEAVIEDLAAKTAVLTKVLPALPKTAIIATNTSSLSVTAIGRAIGEPRRTAGMHFFNPGAADAARRGRRGGRDRSLGGRNGRRHRSRWGKQVAEARDVPGFIVNHVARPYYLEAFRILEDGFADPQEIDQTMRAGGFRMGPLELTDLIGQDVNTATTRSVWEQLGSPASAPSQPAAGDARRGRTPRRKSGQGVYRYDREPPSVAVSVERRPLDLGLRLRGVIDRFVGGSGVTLGSARSVTCSRASSPRSSRRPASRTSAASPRPPTSTRR